MKVNQCSFATGLVLFARLSLISSFGVQKGAYKAKSPPLSRPVRFGVVTRQDHTINGFRSFALSSSLNRCDKYAEVLSKPRWGGPIIGPIVRYFNTFLIAFIFSTILRVFNKFTAVRKELLVDKIFNREEGRGLLTVSNHQSMADDPGLFSAFIPWWRISSKNMRWVLCTEDIFFFVSSSKLFTLRLSMQALRNFSYVAILLYHLWKLSFILRNVLRSSLTSNSFLY